MTLDPKRPARYPLDSIMAAIWDDLGVKPSVEVAKDDRTTPTWHKGSRWLKSNQRRPPSYVWFRGDIDPDAPFKGDLGQYGAEATGGEIVFVHSWGGSEEAAWAMRHNLIAAARMRFGADCLYRGCLWYEPDDQDNGAGFVTRLVFRVPVIGVQYAIAVPEEVGNTAYIVINGSEIQATGD